MMEKILKAVVPVAVVSIIFLIYSSFCDNFTAGLLRWGEIVVVIALFAGLYRFIAREAVSIRDFSSQSFYSMVTVLAFVLTFFAGLVNFSSERFAFNNIVREHPAYLLETTAIVLDDDEYLKRFPAKKKLALLVATRISSHFVPTDEMLKSSGMSVEDYQELINPGRYQGTPGNILDDDREYAEKVKRKVTGISRDTVNVMIPVVEVIKKWAYRQMTSDKVSDLSLDGRVLDGSGEILTGELKKISPVHKNEEGQGMIDIYSILSKSEKFVDIISGSYADRIGEGISDDARRKIIAAFVRTGVSVSPRMKGTIRWIYRYVYDPLFSTFMAILVFFMVISAYRHFDLRKYSTAVITLSAVFVMLGFIPQVESFLNNFIPVSWKGPMSEGWIMNVFSLPVFKAFAIGTGTGVIFMYMGRYWRSFPWRNGDGK